MAHAACEPHRGGGLQDPIAASGCVCAHSLVYSQNDFTTGGVFSGRDDQEQVSFIVINPVYI